MNLDVVHQLLAIFASIAIGWIGVRARWFSGAEEGAEPARLLGQVAMYLFVPALLMRTLARLDLAHLPWAAVQAYYVPALLFAGALYLGLRSRGPAGQPAAAAARTMTAVYGNGVQVGIPLAAALSGEAGLAVHVALVSLHSVLLLTLLTLLAEFDLARRREAVALAVTLRSTLRSALIHPVVLPVLVGLAWNLSGLGLHPVLDRTLAGLGSAAVPLCLVMIGMTLATYDVHGHARAALRLGALKLLAMPAVVLVAARWGFGLQGLALQVCVLMAALPTGTNALIFAQRYRTLEPEASAAVVLSTLAFVPAVALWLAVLAWLP